MGGRVRSVTPSAIGSVSLSAVKTLTGVLTVGALLAGCSSDVTRFDYPSFGLTSNNPQSVKQPVPAQDVPYGAAPAYAGAPPPDYDSAAPIDPKYVYRGPAPAGYKTQSYAAAPQPYAPTSYGAPDAAEGFGTVAGQPESYRPGTGAVVGGPRVAYANPQRYANQPAPTADEQSGFDVGVPEANSAPLIRPPVAPAYPVQPYTGRRPKQGTIVTVLPGETLYQVAKRNGVSVSALMQLNRLRSPVVTAGQQLTMPGKGGRSILPPARPEAMNGAGFGGAGFDPQVAAAEARANPGAPRLNGAALAPLPPARPVVIAAPIDRTAIDKSLDNPDGSYTVRAGNSMYSIARKHGVRPEEIAAANGLKDVTKVNFGQTLRMPGMRASAPFTPKMPGANTKVAALQQPKGGLPAKASASAPVMNDADQDGIPEGGETDIDESTAETAPEAVPLPPAANKTTIARKPNGPVDPASKKLASADPAATRDMAAEADIPSDGRFRWPVRGRIIGKFGPTGKQGGPNEGIDMAVPQGTEVHAAENGVVAYAGDELKGYGRLVLIRHADNWVTAYAHNDEIMVKRGNSVRRGQVIAKSGKSGGVDQPLVHFELRKGSQPVDPMPHMASN